MTESKEFGPEIGEIQSLESALEQERKAEAKVRNEYDRRLKSLILPVLEVLDWVTIDAITGESRTPGGVLHGSSKESKVFFLPPPKRKKVFGIHSGAILGSFPGLATVSIRGAIFGKPPKFRHIV